MVRQDAPYKCPEMVWCFETHRTNALKSRCELLGARGDLREICRVVLLAVAEAQPVLLICSAINPSHERRIRPGVRAGNQAVLYRVVMDVVEMLVEIVLGGDGVFPEAALPDSAFVAMGSG